MKIKNIKFIDKEKWVVTGAAGFIGSHLVDFLLQNNQVVVAIDNFMNGKKENIDYIVKNNAKYLENFIFVEDDIRSVKIGKLFEGADYVLHQAALGSVPRSFLEPELFNDININGFINIFKAANSSGIKNFVYASSSSVYGDKNNFPQIEDQIGVPLSPYALSKRADEVCASFFESSMNIYGLRYFNVFGARQDPNGAYAAVIPKWILSLLKGEAAAINGNGENSRDFCFVDNAVQANIIASLTVSDNAGQIYNVAVGERTSLNMLYDLIVQKLLERAPESIKIQSKIKPPLYRMARKGDVIHSQADISKIKNALGYFPKFDIKKGLDVTVDWYIDKIFHSD